MANIRDELEPSILVIFGITGDLSKRYLLPALYHLIKNNLLHEKTQIVGVTRGDTTAQDLLSNLRDALQDSDGEIDDGVLDNMTSRTSMFKMNLDNADDYKHLLDRLNQIEGEQSLCMNRLYYLSIPPEGYSDVISLLGQNGLNSSCPHGAAMCRLLVEKPLGHDYESAKQLVETMAEYFGEEQIFRIDHYMAKETVQNMLTFRFHNPIFGALWNNDYITKIEISAREKIGIEGRAQFYDKNGALRDFIPSHLMQILGIITMDRPDQLDSQQIHAKKQAVLEKVIAVQDVAKNAARGQYKGYRDEVHNPDSTIETYAAITVEIDNDRWRGVPIKLLTGKSLSERKTEITIDFYGKEGLTHNTLHIRIQPDEGVELNLMTKQPGYSYELKNTPMEFYYRDDFGDNSLPNAYERVLVDAIRGSHTLFATSEEVMQSWRIVEPVIEAWANNSDGMIYYEPGTVDPEKDQNA